MIIRRLDSTDRELARATFLLLGDVFEEPAEPLDDTYLDELLADRSFWALVALDGARPVGGVVAHTLPLTKRKRSEIFLYDIAVDPAFQRMGVGRGLVATLRELAAREGVDVVFVPADVEDLHALAFYRALGGKPAAVEIFTFDEA